MSAGRSSACRSLLPIVASILSLALEVSRARSQTTSDLFSLAGAARAKYEGTSDTAGKRDIAKQQRADAWLPAVDIVAQLASSGSLQDQLTTSATLLYDVPFEGAVNTHLAVVGNIGGAVSTVASPDTLAETLASIRTSQQGTQVGLDYYYILVDNTNGHPTNFSWIPHVTATGKVNRVTQLDGTASDFAQFVFGVGFSSGIGMKSGEASNRPIHASLKLDYSAFDSAHYRAAFGASRDHFVSLEWTLLLPVASSGTGVLFEGVATDGLSPVWHAGLTVARKSTKSTEPSRKKSDAADEKPQSSGRKE